MVEKPDAKRDAKVHPAATKARKAHYEISMRGELPEDITERISQAHARAVEANDKS